MNIIGIDIGGTKCAVVAGDASGKITFRESFPTTDCKSTLERIFIVIENLKRLESSVFGISCGSPLDSAKGVILSPPNLPGWDNIKIVEMLESRFSGRAYLMNDANAGALAEWKYGAGRGYHSIIFITSGTGFGSGLILDGKLYEGVSGMAGEVGHIRLADSGPVGYGKAGSAEGFCSGGGIAQIAKEKARELNGKVFFNKTGIENITAKDVAEAAKSGDTTALDIFKTVGKNYGRILSILIDLFNPEAIILGSIYVKCQTLIEPELRRVLAEETLDISLRACKILPATLGDQIGDYAALSVAVYNEEIK